MSAESDTGERIIEVEYVVMEVFWLCGDVED